MQAHEIEVGDLLELGSWGRWILHTPGDYGKNSREWMMTGGTFLVLDKQHHVNNHPNVQINSYNFELYDLATHHKAMFGMSADGSDRTGIILKHIPAERTNGL